MIRNTWAFLVCNYTCTWAHLSTRRTYYWFEWIQFVACDGSESAYGMAFVRYSSLLHSTSNKVAHCTQIIIVIIIGRMYGLTFKRCYNVGNWVVQSTLCVLQTKCVLQSMTIRIRFEFKLCVLQTSDRLILTITDNTHINNIEHRNTTEYKCPGSSPTSHTCY